jgi:hypothetical protein
VSTRSRLVRPRLELADLRAEQRLRQLIDRVWPERWRAARRAVVGRFRRCSYCHPITARLCRPQTDLSRLRSRRAERSKVDLGPPARIRIVIENSTTRGERPVDCLQSSWPVGCGRRLHRPRSCIYLQSGHHQCAGTCTFPPIGHGIPVPFNPQYPSGFFARYCW